MTSTWAWSDGKIIAASELSLSPWTNAAHYGTGVFEGIRCYPAARGPAVFRLRDHMQRLLRSARYYGLAVAFSADQLSAATLELLAKEGADYVYIRPLVIFGEGPPQLAVKRNCPTRTMILTRPMGKFLGEENYGRGIRLTVSSWRKTHHTVLPTTAKGCGQYLNSVIAAQEATDRGFDDALMLTVEGTVSEGTGANVFFVRGGRVYTNDAASSILPGITRDTVIELFKLDGIEVCIRTFTLPDLLDADEVFVTGTAAEVTPVREIDGRTYAVGEGTVGFRMQRRYANVVLGRDTHVEHWLSYVERVSGEKA